MLGMILFCRGDSNSSKLRRHSSCYRSSGLVNWLGLNIQTQ